MTPEFIKTVCKAIAVLSVIAGGVGSIMLVPFAFSSNMVFVTTAGIYFIAGAVMIVGGLYCYQNLVRTN